MTTNFEETQALYHAAQTRYAQAANLGSVSEILEAMEAIQASLACTSADDAQPLPEGYADLQQRVTLAIAAIESPPPDESWTKLHEVYRKAESDATLEVVLSLLGLKYWNDLVELNATLQQLEQAAADKLANEEPIEAAKVLRQGLDMLLDAEVLPLSLSRVIERGAELDDSVDFKWWKFTWNSMGEMILHSFRWSHNLDDMWYELNRLEGRLLDWREMPEFEKLRPEEVDRFSREKLEWFEKFRVINVRPRDISDRVARIARQWMSSMLMNKFQSVLQQNMLAAQKAWDANKFQDAGYIVQRILELFDRCKPITEDVNLVAPAFNWRAERERFISQWKQLVQDELSAIDKEYTALLTLLAAIPEGASAHPRAQDNIQFMQRKLQDWQQGERASIHQCFSWDEFVRAADELNRINDRLKAAKDEMRYVLRRLNLSSEALLAILTARIGRNIKGITYGASERPPDFSERDAQGNFTITYSQGCITGLSLARMGLSKLPSEIELLVDLVWLDLSGNYLATLPEELAELPKLNTLTLQHNNFKEFPSVIIRLQNLRRLDMSMNFLEDLPATLGDMRNLEALHLWHNNLTKLPSRIGLLSKLRVLDLSWNGLQALPETIGLLAALQELVLHDNELTILPVEIGQLQSLQRLDLGNNSLEALPPEIGQLAQLEELSINATRILALPLEMRHLTHLQRLYAQTIGNVLVLPPPDIVKQGAPAVVAYLRDVQAGIITPPGIPAEIPVSASEKPPILVEIEGVIIDLQKTQEVLRGLDAHSVYKTDFIAQKMTACGFTVQILSEDSGLKINGEYLGLTQPERGYPGIDPIKLAKLLHRLVAGKYPHTVSSGRGAEYDEVMEEFAAFVKQHQSG